MRKTTSICFVLISAITSIGFAQDPSPSPPGNQETSDVGSTDPALSEIRAGAQAFVDAFNKADAAAVASLWTDNGEYVDDSGMTHVGPQAIEKVYAEFFSANPGAKLRINIDSLKLLSETAAMEEGNTLVEVPPVGATIGRYMAVHVKVDGKWRMASVRDTLVEAPVAQNLADLDWLVGTWVAEEQGNKMESVCHWVSERSFVQRDYTTTLFDGTKTSGVQLIGWNPQAGHVQSWMFSPDGGHAIGAWMPSEDGWIAQTQGMTGNGISTTSTNTLRRLDDNAYVWQSVNRTMGGVAIPDTDEVVLRRQRVTK